MRQTLSKIKYAIRYLIAVLFFYTGISQLLIKFRLANRIVVLTYHRIMPSEISLKSFSNRSIIVDTLVFERQMHLIKNYFEIIAMDELQRRLENNTETTRPVCVITIDDGWEDNYEYAYPILKKLGIIATIFLPVDYIENSNLFWQEKLARKLNQLAEQNNDVARKLLGHLEVGSITAMDSRTRKISILNFLARIKSDYSYQEIDALEAKICGALSNPQKSNHIDRYLDWKQVREMQKSGIDFGSHCCSHRILTQLSDEEIRHELTKSAEVIEEKTGLARVAVAYPNGNNDKTVQQMAAISGYKLGFGTKYGFVDDSDNLYDIRRVNVNERTTNCKPLFLLALLGYFS